MAALALSFAAPAAAEAKRSVPYAFHGVVYDGPLTTAPFEVQQRQFDVMASSGVESIRMAFNWAAAQPSKGDRFDWSATDRGVELAASHGMTVLPVVIYAPYWARVHPRRFLSPPRTNPYLAYLKAAVRRYRQGGAFWRQNAGVPERPLRYWQVWNEPSLRALWDTSRKGRYGWPHGYARLLRDANRAIKRTDPRARTVTAGLVGAAWTELRSLYAHGARGTFDVVAVHIYPENEQHVREAIRRVRAETRRARDGRRRIFLTEVSFPASKGRSKPIGRQRQETPRGMARRLTAMFRLLAAHRGRLGLDRVYWYTWASDYVRRSSAFNFAGLVGTGRDLTLRPQPALDAFRRVARLQQGCRKNILGHCR